MAAVLTSSKPRNPMLDVIGQRNFRLLWIGQGTSLLGDQFALIAPLAILVPFLVLTLLNLVMAGLLLKNIDVQQADLAPA